MPERLHAACSIRRQLLNIARFADGRKKAGRAPLERRNLFKLGGSWNDILTFGRLP